MLRSYEAYGTGHKSYLIRFNKKNRLHAPSFQVPFIKLLDHICSEYLLPHSMIPGRSIIQF